MTAARSLRDEVVKLQKDIATMHAEMIEAGVNGWPNSLMDWWTRLELVDALLADPVAPSPQEPTNER